MRKNGVSKRQRSNFNFREDRITGKSHLKVLMLISKSKRKNLVRNTLENTIKDIT